MPAAVITRRLLASLHHQAKSANVVASSQGIAKEKEALLARVAQLESQLQSKSTATLTESGPQKKISLLEVQLASSDSEKKALAAEMKRLLAVVEAEKKAAEELRANLKAMEAGKSRVLEGIRRELDDRERALHARQAQLDTSAQQRDAEQRRAIEQRENELRQSFDQREKALQRDAELRTLELTAALAQKDKELAAALSKTVLKGQAPTPADKDSNTVSTVGYMRMRDHLVEMLLTFTLAFKKKKTSRADGAQSTETARVLTKQPTASSTLFSLLFSLAIILGICAAVTVTLFPELFEQMPDYSSVPVSIVQNYYAHARATAPTVIADAQEYLSQIFVGQ